MGAKCDRGSMRKKEGLSKSCQGRHFSFRDRPLMIDPTNTTKDVVHFMIPKPVVMQIAELVNKSGLAEEGLMKFTFKLTV